MLRFICHKVHLLKMYSSIVFSIFTELHTHHHSLIIEHFHHPPNKTSAHQLLLLIPHSTLPCLSEKAMAPHSSTLAWKIPWTEEPGGLQSMGSRRVGTTERLHFHFSLSCIGEGDGNPLQCSCLENPRDREAWWAAVYGVAQSRTRLKQLSSSSIHYWECKIVQLSWKTVAIPQLPCDPASLIT